MRLLTEHNLILGISVPKNIAEFVNKVLEYIVNVDLLDHALRQLIHEPLVDGALECIHLVRVPVEVKEVFNLSDKVFVHGVASVIL